MNADKMTREEFDVWVGVFESKHTPDERKEEAKNKLWARFNAAQSATFVPNWSLKPKGCLSFRGGWSTLSAEDSFVGEGEFVIPAPSSPTDAELSAMWEKLDRDKRVQILRDAGVVV